MVFITGDIAYSGQPSEYAAAGYFIKELAKKCDVGMDAIVCVPGNHDVDRDRIIQPDRVFVGTEEVVETLEEGEKLRRILSRQENYFEFIRTLFPWALQGAKNSLSFTINKIVHEIPIGLLLLNSAWIAGTDMDYGRVVIGERQVRDALKDVHDPAILVALMHYPISYLAEFDAVDVRGLLNTRCDFVLHGQIHDSGALRLRYPDSEVFYIAAGSSYLGRKELMSYNFVSLDLEASTGKFFLRRYSDLGIWSADTDMYESAPEGVIEFRLPERITKKARRPKAREIHVLFDQLTPQAAKGTTFAQVEPPPEVPAPPPALVKEICEGRCVLFAGSGASVDAQLPTWPELVRDLVDEASKTSQITNEASGELEYLITRKEYLPAAEYCREKIGLFAFSQYLKNRLSHINRSSQTHRLLSEIPFRAAITTNYDKFVEYYHNGAIVILPDTMERIGGTSMLDASLGFPVVKISGSLEDVNSIVLTQSDFRKLSFKSPNYIDFIRNIMTNFTILFYGSGFVDPNVNFLLQQVFTVSGGISRPHYAILGEQGPIKREFWYRNYNIRIISYRVWQGSHIVAREFLQNLADCCKQ
jgi:SIR2-like domain